LYRKYRPATFAEVVGQEHVTEPISQALRSGRIHHAYLFSGPRGCGKTSSARILARSLNCENGPTPTPCGECDSCVALAPMGPGSLDVIEIDAASHGLVDDARDLRDRAFFAPVSSRYKVYVIDEAHMITTAAFNALLKVVEEPPPHVKFIFATTEPDKVLGTIKSRTFHYRFRLIPPAIMREHLAGLCVREGIEVDPLVLPLVVRAGAGSARDAQSILDQLAAGAGSAGISYDLALSLLGYTDAALLDEVVDAFAAGDGASVFRAVDRVMEAGLDPRRFAQDLLERFRDLLVLDAVPDAGTTGLLDVPDDELERMRGQAGHYGRPSLSRAADVLATALVDMRGTTSPRLVLELACARILLPGAADDTSALLARLDRMERRLSATGVPVAPAAAPDVPATAPAESRSAPAAEPVSDAAEPVSDAAEVEPDAADPVAVTAPVTSASVASAPVASAPAAPAAPGVVDVMAVRRLWDDVLDAVKLRSRKAQALMFSSQIEELSGTTLTLSFSTPTLARLFDEVSDYVREAIREVVGHDLVVRATSGGATVTGTAATSAARPPEAPAAPGSIDVTSDMPPDDLPDDASEDDEVSMPDVSRQDPQVAAMALLQEGLGARVIGEIDRA
jgi:DNA polymerase-3 subunit gamma/tau